VIKPFDAITATGPFASHGLAWLHRATLAGLMLLVCVPAAAIDHDKTDIVTTTDGATYVGEIKDVQYATITLDTDPAGTIELQWRYVTGLQSKYRYRVRLAGGDLKFGTLGVPSEKGLLNIVGDPASVEVGLDKIVEIVPFEHGFWERLDGSLNFGLTYTKSSEAFQYNLGADISYRRPAGYAQLTAQSILNKQKGAAKSDQHNLQFSMSHPWSNKWGWFETAQVQSNPDQGYQLRTIVGGGVSNFMIEQTSELLLGNFGVVYNREEVTDSSTVDNSLEATAGISFRKFKTRSGVPSLQVSLQAFRDLSGSSRFRATLNFVISWKLASIFNVNFQVQDNYDSDPPGTDSLKNDVNVITSIGYTF